MDVTYLYTNVPTALKCEMLHFWSHFRITRNLLQFFFFLACESLDWSTFLYEG